MKWWHSIVRGLGSTSCYIHAGRPQWLPPHFGLLNKVQTPHDGLQSALAVLLQSEIIGVPYSHWKISSVRQSPVHLIHLSPFRAQSKAVFNKLSCRIWGHGKNPIAPVSCEALCHPAVTLCHPRPRKGSPLSGGLDRNLLSATLVPVSQDPSGL